MTDYRKTTYVWHIPSWKFKILRPLKKFPAFYKTRTFITNITRSRHVPDVSPVNLVHIVSFYLFRTRFNTIVPYVTRSSKWFRCFRFSHTKKSMHFYFIPQVLRRFSSYSPKYGYPKIFLKTKNHAAPHYATVFRPPVTYSRLGPKNLPASSSRTPPGCILR